MVEECTSVQYWNLKLLFNNGSMNYWIGSKNCCTDWDHVPLYTQCTVLEPCTIVVLKPFNIICY